MSNGEQKYSDRYWRILLHREKDHDLLAWLLKHQNIGERPNAAIKRRLNELMEKNK